MMMDMADPSQVHDVLPKGEAFGAFDQVVMAASESDAYEYDFYALTEKIDIITHCSEFGWVPNRKESLESTDGESKNVFVVMIPSYVYEYNFYALTEQVDLIEGHSEFGWVPIFKESLKSNQGEIKNVELVTEKHFSCGPLEHMMGIDWDGSTLFIVGYVSERSLYRVDIVEEVGVDGRILPKKYTFDGFPGMARFNDAVAVVNKGTYFFVPGYGKESTTSKNDKWSDVVVPYKEGLEVVHVRGCFD